MFKISIHITLDGPAPTQAPTEPPVTRDPTEPRSVQKLISDIKILQKT